MFRHLAAAVLLVQSAHSFLPASRLNFLAAQNRQFRSATGSIWMTARPSQLPVVVVAGATGRIGRLVVNELLANSMKKNSLNVSRPEVKVRALARDVEKAKLILPKDSPFLEIVKCDLSNNDDIRKACDSAAAAVWCASGFSATSSLFDRIKSLLTLKLARSSVIDISSLSAFGSALKNEGSVSPLGGPRIVMCSSAAVTRPSWSEAKKKRYPGAADIPIVRLNPFGILDVKREGEEALRATGASYCVLRPCGLNDKWPPGRPLLSQGDLAVGRSCPQDVAAVLAALLHEPSAARGLTLECFTLAGYPAPASLGPQLERLRTDAELAAARAGGAAADYDAASDAHYALLQQLVPGETMAPERLAMGQTYEQLDAGRPGRLGPRGAEQPPIGVA